MALSRRERLSALAAGLGVIRLLEALPRRPGLLILNYHRVGDPEKEPFDPGVVEVTPTEFDEHMAWLKKRYDLADLAEVQEMVARPHLLRHCHVLVTFDDGYRDNHDVVLPILQAHGIRATFFLATGFVGTHRIPWWDQVAWMVRHARTRQIRLRYPKEELVELATTTPAAAIARLLRIYKHPDTADTERFLSEVEEACGVTRPTEGSEPLFMTWEEAKNLVSAGMAIGSHTHRHELLAKLSRNEQLAECQLSRDLIKEKLGRAVDALAFPGGSRTSFSGITEQCLRETGYRAAFSYYGGVNTPGSLNPFDLRRIPVGYPSLRQYRLRNALAAVTARELW